MENKKDIGLVFKEKLRQLDKSPADNGWIAIQKELDKKKKRRVIPFWFFFATGVICCLIGYYSFNHLSNPSKLKLENDNTEHQTLDDSDSHHSVSDSITMLQNKKSAATEVDLNSTEAKSNQEVTKTSETSVKNKSKSKSTFQKNSANSKRKLNTLATEKKTQKSGRSKNHHSTKNASNQGEKDETLTSNNNLNTELANNQTADKFLLSGSISTKQQEKDSTAIKNDSIAKKAKTNIKKENLIDSTKTETPEIEPDAIVFSPYFGYTYTRILGNSSNNFTGTTIVKQGIEISANYGILARWMGTKKIGLQTGFGILQFNRFSEIEKNGAFFISNSSIRLNRSNEALEAVFQDATKIKVRQKVSFYEVPLELYFVLSDKKIGIATTVGMSFLFIHKNTVYLESSSVNEFAAGESTDIAKQSFTGNAKLNFFYNLNPKIQLNLYPEIQFQFMGNPDRMSDYVPYYISIKTGFTYKF